MYIDIHFHADARGEARGDLPAVSKWMDAHQVDRVILLPLERTLPRDSQEEHRMLDNFKAYEGRIYRFCVMPPVPVSNGGQILTLLKQEKEEGAIGFGEHYGRGLDFDDAQCMQLYAACAEVGFPVLFHSDGECNMDDAELSHLENALKSHPGCAFIGHGPGFWSKVKRADKLMQTHRNLYADISAGSGARGIGGDKDYGREFIVRHADRVLFGTDGGPWSLGKDDAAPQFELVQSLDLSLDVKAKLCRENAEKLFEFSSRR